MWKSIVLPAVVVMILGTASVGVSESASVMLEKGIHAEQTRGDLDAAIKIYKQIVEDAKANRQHAAEAQYRLGRCLLKKKRPRQAEAAFQELIAEFPTCREFVAKARKQIAECRKRITGPELVKIVEEAVMTISTCAEQDPRVKQSLASLKGLNEQAVVKTLARFLGSERSTVRRSAIYSLWKGDFASIDPAVPGLMKLCQHTEDVTRGMAALALGGRKINSSLQALCDMTLKDKSPYARRCAAYALGLLGQADARGVLQKALKDKNELVRKNAKAALIMLGLGGPAKAGEPLVLKTTPAAYATDVVASRKEITVTFDRAMMDKSWSWTMYGKGETFPKTTGAPSYDETTRTCTLPVGLQPGKVYWVGINSAHHHDFQTPARIPARPYVILFATARADGKPTPIPRDLLAQTKAINARSARAPVQARARLPVGPAPWADGEELYMDIKSPTGADLGVAVATMESATVGGRKVWRMQARYVVANMLMRSRVVVDRDTALPISSQLTGDQIGDLRTDYTGRSIVWTIDRGGKKTSRTIGLEHTVYDDEQVGDLVRRLPLAKGLKAALAAFSTQNGLISRYDLEVVGKEKVTVPAGTYDCHRVHLDVSIGGVKMKYRLWLSADRHRYPVKMDVHALVLELRRARVKPKGEAKPVTFKDPKRGISLVAPAGWVFHATAEDAEPIALLLLPPDMKTWAILASRRYAEDLPSSREAAEIDIKSLRELFKGYTVRPKSWTAVTLSGIPAASFVADYTQQGRKMVEYRTYICGKSVAYWFVFRVEKGKFDANKATYDSIVKSFKAKPGSSRSAPQKQ